MNAQQDIPITENENIKNIFKLYQKHGMTQEKSDTESLVKHIEFMESQFGKVFEELQTVRSQLQSLQDKGIKATVTKIVDAVETKVTEAKTQFTSIKDSVVKSFSGAVNAVKEKGVSALKNTVDFLKIRSALSFLKNKLDQSVNSLRQSVMQIEKVKTELHAAKSHTLNVGRLIFKKDVKETAYESNRGILAGIQKLLNKMGGLLSGISGAAASAMNKIDGLGQRNEKSSVRQSLKDIKNTRTKNEPSAPEQVRDKAR